MLKYNLSSREQSILQYIVRQYILTANPVGSRTVSKSMDLHLSPASIRNIMADLEDKGFIDHPHTSAGRVPTDKGYRFFVDSMSRAEDLSPQDIESLESHYGEANSTDTEYIARESSRLLSKITRQLAIVSSPHIGSTRLKRIELVQVVSNRIMVILSMSSGFIKSIILEVDGEIGRIALDRISSSLNERLAGLTLHEIRETFFQRMKDAPVQHPSLMAAMVQSSDKMFSDYLDTEKIYVDGIHIVMRQPEFGDPEQLRNMIEVVENQNIILHILDSFADGDDVVIKIGSELEEERLREYSIVAAPYRVGETAGTLSIIGPRRMNYPRMIAIIEALSKLISV